MHPRFFFLFWGDQGYLFATLSGHRNITKKNHKIWTTNNTRTDNDGDPPIFFVIFCDVSVTRVAETYP